MELIKCTQPWFEMQILSSQQQVRCCCFWAGKADLWDSTLPFSVEQHWNSQNLQAIRKVVSSNRPQNTPCQFCQALKYAHDGLFKKVPQGLNARQRDNWNKAWSNYEAKKVVVDSYPVRYALNFGLACQLKCVMCCQETARDKHKQSLPVNWLLEMKDYLTLASEFLIWGGEPFVIPNARRFMEAVISDSDYQDVQLRFITNGMLLHQWIEPLQAMKRIHIKVSVDAVGKTYEQIRRGASWKVVEKNILAVKNLIDKHKLDWQIKVTSLVMRSSLPSMLELIDWGIKHDIPVHWLPVGQYGYPIPNQEAVFHFPQLLDSLPQWENLFDEAIQRLLNKGWFEDSALPLFVMKEELQRMVAKRQQMLRHSQTGREYYRQGDLENSAKVFREAEGVAYPESGLVMELGKCYYDLKLYDQALNCFRNVVSTLGEFPEAYHNLANVLVKQGRLEEAVLCYQRVLELQPNSLEIYWKLSEVLQTQGKTQEAIACREKVLQLQTGRVKMGSKPQVIHCIGDSHVCFFTGRDEIPVGSSYESLLPFFKVHHLGPVLAYSLGGEEKRREEKRREEKKSGRDKLFALLDNNIPKGSHVMLCFGEIDCRFHLLRQAHLQKRPIAEIVNECVDGYFSAILLVKEKGYSVMVWNAVPSGEGRNPEYPHYGSQYERNQVSKLFNEFLATRLIHAGLVYVQIFDKLILPSGLSKMEYFLDDVHLSSKAMPLAIAELEKLVPEIDFTQYQPRKKSENMKEQIDSKPLVFDMPHSLAINQARLEHLASLGLPLPTLQETLPSQQYPLGTPPPIPTPTVPELSNLFKDWINTLGRAHNRLYYRDQTPASLNALVQLVHQYQPTKIVELGTLFGLSLRTWLSANTPAEIIAIDLSFRYLRQSQSLIPIDLSKVKLLEQDILTVDFRSLWTAQDRVLFFIDAHDRPHHQSMMEHLLQTVIPLLPSGSVVAVDDIWYSPNTLTKENIQPFLDKVVWEEMDPLHVFQASYAPYWKGGSCLGFLEVIPLLRWVDQHQIHLHFQPNTKSVSFLHG